MFIIFHCRYLIALHILNHCPYESYISLWKYFIIFHLLKALKGKFFSEWGVSCHLPHTPSISQKSGNLISKPQVDYWTGTGRKRSQTFWFLSNFKIWRSPLFPLWRLWLEYAFYHSSSPRPSMFLYTTIYFMLFDWLSDILWG